MDVRRELNNIRKHYREYHRDYGESIVWFEYLARTSPASAGSIYDDVYDEGTEGASGRRYRDGIVLPVLMIAENEDQRRAIPEGRQTVQLTNFVASLDDWRRAGVTDPYEYRHHLNDMFLYDGRYFNIATYRVRGRARDDVLIVVEGYETYVSEEMPNDPGPGSLGITNLPWPSTIAGN